MILVIVSLFAFQATAQIRNYVGIVRGDYSPEMVSFLEEYRDNLKENGYTTYAKYVDAYLKGGFGSGFVYVDSDGTNYIITNRHVVSDSASASIEFEDAETGSKTKYENLSIFATDDDIDIAVLKFADGKILSRLDCPLALLKYQMVRKYGLQVSLVLGENQCGSLERVLLQMPVPESKNF